LGKRSQGKQVLLHLEKQQQLGIKCKQIGGLTGKEEREEAAPPRMKESAISKMLRKRRGKKKRRGARLLKTTGRRQRHKKKNGDVDNRIRSDGKERKGDSIVRFHR